MSALFDLSFHKFIAPTIAKIVYVLIMIGIGLTYLVFVISAFSQSAAAGLFVLIILGPIASLLYLVMSRVFLEALLAQIRTAENTTEMLAVMRGGQGFAGPAGPSFGTPAPAPTQPWQPAPPTTPGYDAPPPPPAPPTA